MSENKVIIEFISDTTQLESASSSFEKLGVTAKKVLQDMGTTLSQTNAKQKESTEIIDKNTRSVNDLAKATQNAQKAAVGDFGKKAFMEMIKIVEGGTNEMQQLKDAVLLAKEALNFTDDKGEIENLTRMIQQAEAHIAQFGQETQEATGKQASFRSQIRMSKEELAQMAANGEITVEKLLQIARASGEMQDNLGDAQQAIQALASDTFPLDALLQGVTSITAGFQVAQGAAALFGDENEDLQKVLVRLNAVMAITQGLQAILNNLQKTSAQSLGLNIAAQKLYTFVVGESTGALRGFKLALAATGIGLAIIAIGELVANWDKLKVSIFGATQSLDDYKESLDKVKEQSDKNLNALETELKIRRLLGDLSEEEAMKQSIAYKKELEADLVGRLLKQKEKVDELKKTYGEYYEEQKTNGNKDIKREEAKFDAINTLYRTSLGERLDSEKDLKDFQDKAAQDELDRLKKQQEEKQKFIEKYLAEKLKKEKEAISQEIALQEIVLLELQGNARERLKVEENLIFLKGELAKKDAKSTVEKALIEARVISDTEALRKKFRENELSQIKLRQDRTLEAESKILDAELERERKRREAHRERLRELDEYRAAEEAYDEEMRKKKEERDSALKQQAIDQAFAIAQNIADGIFNIQAQSIRRELDADLNALYKKRDAELSNKNLTEEQKARINDRYHKEELKLKKRAFDQEQNMKAVQAAINTALAVTMAFAQLGPIGGAIAAAGLIAAMAVQIATIKTAKFPGFRKGTKNAPSGFKWVGEEGPELIHDKGGYPIITHGDSKVLAQMLDKYGIGHELKGGNIPQIPVPAASRSVIERSQLEKTTNNYHNNNIDYEKLGDIMSEKVSNAIAQHPKTHITMDKNGIRTFLEEGSSYSQVYNHNFNL